ncbi:uncharacterized protein LOC134461425 isoform X2 [Engraulis encrasicolus]|uniref:uncharacterized protein LOC134461425 isoform X2 n=1 Tax=Engraulis encrasicolus TaxID=184585 RepID=UPI002FD31277
MAPGSKMHKLKLMTIVREIEIYPCDDVTMPCQLSPAMSAVSMEIRWFKGAECVYLYKDGAEHEGRGYEGRFHMDPAGLPRGNVSLKLWESDEANEDRYTCQVISGNQRDETRLMLNYNGESGALCADPSKITDRLRKRMDESVKALICRMSPSCSQLNVMSTAALPPAINPAPAVHGEEVKQEATSAPAPSAPVAAFGAATTFGASVATGAVATSASVATSVPVAAFGSATTFGEATTFGAAAAAAAASVDTEMEIDSGLMTTVNKKKRRMEDMKANPMMKDYKLKLTTISREMEIYPGDDVTMTCQLSPATSAVSMEIRWFKGAQCVYLYRDGAVHVGRGYKGRFHVDPVGLQRGDVSLKLWESDEANEDRYTCQVISGQQRDEKRLMLKYNGESGVICTDPSKITDRLRKKMEESVHGLIHGDSPSKAAVKSSSSNGTQKRPAAPASPKALPVARSLSTSSSTDRSVEEEPRKAPAVVRSLSTSSIQRSVLEPLKALAVHTHFRVASPAPVQPVEINKPLFGAPAKITTDTTAMTATTTDLEQLREQFEKEKKEMEQRHREEMEEMRARYERAEASAEAQRNLGMILLPEVKMNINIFKAQLEEEFKRQMQLQPQSRHRGVQNGATKAMTHMMGRFHHQVAALVARLEGIHYDGDIEMDDVRESLKREMEKEKQKEREMEKEGGGFHREIEAMENDRVMTKKSRLF